MDALQSKNSTTIIPHNPCLLQCMQYNMPTFGMLHMITGPQAQTKWSNPGLVFKFIAMLAAEPTTHRPLGVDVLPGGELGAHQHGPQTGAHTVHVC